MDKSKIKNIALGVSLGLNLLLGFFLGGGLISSCAAKKPVEASSSASVDASGEFIDPLQKRALAPRLAASEEIDPNDYENLWDASSSNFSRIESAFIYNDANGSHFKVGQGYITNLKIVEKGLYAFKRVPQRYSWGSDWGGTCLVNSSIYDDFVLSPNNFVFTPYRVLWNDEFFYFYVTDAMLADGVYLSCGSVETYMPQNEIYLIDGDALPASDRVVFPRAFFPWQIWGNRATDLLIGGPAVSSGTLAESQSLTFSNLFFRCNGRTYKGIMMVFSYRPGQHLGRYDPAGEIYSNGTIVYSSSNPPWFLDKMLYIPADSGMDYDIVLTANYAQLGDSMLLMPNPVWSKDVYRTIDIVDASAATMSGVPSGVGTNTPMEWLNIIAASEVIASTSVASDPFAMLGNGFAAVANILSIPILPFMTLGTLIAVPLIVLVILAILRLLAK